MEMENKTRGREGGSGLLRARETEEDAPDAWDRKGLESYGGPLVSSGTGFEKKGVRTLSEVFTARRLVGPMG
jgi:hypothetical protein